MKSNDTFAIIMAGGIGSRFWPLSSKDKPKQFIDILGTGKTLVQQTVERFKNICPMENIFIITGKEYFDIVHQQIPELCTDNIICEPFRRNTAPCIAYATYKIFLKSKKANIIVAPSDHLILDSENFTACIIEGLDYVANNESLLTLGIIPNRPETGYGYIQRNDSVDNYPNIKNVKSFTEKPNIELARKFIESGDFLWNSGIFIWNVKTILEAYKEHLPNLVSLFKDGLGYINTNKEAEFISNVYAETHAISIDYSILEKADNVCVLCADFGWSDLGTWKSFHEHSEKDKDDNVINSNNSLLIDTSNCIINIPKEKNIVVQGMDNYIISEHDNTILICKRDNEDQIKSFSEKLKMKKKAL
jgi:mannose-1-phosphate guanylyltransferase